MQPRPTMSVLFASSLLLGTTSGAARAEDAPKDNKSHTTPMSVYAARRWSLAFDQ